MKFLKTAFILIFTSILILTFGCSVSYTPVRFEGKSMMPSYKDGDRILINRDYGELKRGDVISFRYPKDPSKFYFKRVIGLPNEKVEIRQGQVSINDKELDEPYLDQSYNQQKSSFAPKVVPQDNYYVIGDNRDNSSDSRYWGFVSKDLIVGRASLTY